MRRVYQEARRIAHSVLRGKRNQTWGTTILVNEAFARLLGPRWAKQLKAAPDTIVPMLRQIMENALIDHHRRKSAARRPEGDHRTRVYYEDGMTVFDDDPAQFLEILLLMERLRAGQLGDINVKDPKKFAEAVELGFILGISDRQIADQLDVPQTTVSRWLRFGRAMLNKALALDSDKET